MVFNFWEDKVNIFIFTEYGGPYGYGHLFRCLSLYDAFQEKGFKVHLVLESKSEIDYTERPCQHLNWKDQTQLCQLDLTDSLCFVDSYKVDIDQLQYINDRALELIVIDDNARLPYENMTILNPTLDTSDLPYDKTCKVLYGQKYLLLRKAFRPIGGYTIHTSVKRLLVMMGGNDVSNTLTRVLNKLEPLSDQYEIHVVGGKKVLGDLVKTSFKFYGFLDADDLSQLMQSMDLVITAAGQTIYELMSLRVPFIPIMVASNQNHNMTYLKDNDLIPTYLSLDDLNSSRLIDTLNMMSNFNLRTLYADKYADLIKVRGVETLHGYIKKEIMRFSFLPVTMDHADLLLTWANEEEVRKNSFQSSMITYKDHVKWLKSKIESSDSSIYLVKVRGEFVGQIRIDIRQGLGYIDYTVAKNHRRKGYGSIILGEAKEYFKSIGIEKLIGQVKHANMASIKAFQRAGFSERITNDYYEFEHIMDK